MSPQTKLNQTNGDENNTRSWWSELEKMSRDKSSNSV